MAAFSDAVFPVIITIMVLDLKPPPEHTFRALAPLWPTAVSYVVSYFFIAIIWVNHITCLGSLAQPLRGSSGGISSTCS